MKPLKITWITVLLSFVSAILSPAMVWAKEFVPLELGTVQVGGEIGRRINITIHENLLKLDVDKDFLAPFVSGDAAGQTYIGLGKLINAAVLFAKYSNNPEVIALKEHLVDTAIHCQKPDGYIGFIEGQDKLIKMWTAHELGYLMQGLISDYQFFENHKALDAAQKIGDLFIELWKTKPDYVTPDIPNFVGDATAFLLLYRSTNQQKYLDFAADSTALAVRTWSGKVDGHTYTWLSHCLDQIHLYHHQPAPDLLNQSRRTIDFMLRDHGMAVTGGVSQNEFWHRSQDGCGHSSETCAIAYLLRFLHHMLQLEGDSLYGDMAERVLYNSLFAAQSPDGRKIRYYCPSEGPREYFSQDIYCCPNNYRRIIAELPTMIYYISKATPGFLVNLYTPSNTTFHLNDGTAVSVEQVTDYPYSEHVTFTIKTGKPAKFPIYLRIPRWCTGESSISVNGSTISKTVKPGIFFELECVWDEADKIDVYLPMSWTFVKGRKNQSGKVALMRGPVVFGMNPDHNPEVTKQVEPQLYHEIIIDPTTLTGPFPVPSGERPFNACKCKVWKPGWLNGSAVDKPGYFYSDFNEKVEMTLTEFSDPGGRAIYFRTYPAVGVEDELYNPSTIPY